MNDPTPEIKGGRNLAIFGIAAILIALTTSGVSLAVYHITGDIYLDRSRPGFIPEGGDDDTKPETTDPSAIFPPDGTLTEKDIDTYLKNLDTLIQDITADPGAFSDEDLTDTALGISDQQD